MVEKIREAREGGEEWVELDDGASVVLVCIADHSDRVDVRGYEKYGSGGSADLSFDDAEAFFERSLALVRRRKAQLEVAALEVEGCHRYPSQGAWARAYMEDYPDWTLPGLPLVKEVG